GQIDPTDPNKAQGAINKVLGDANALNADTAKFHQEAEKARTDWEARRPQYEQAVRQVEELEAWEDPKAAPLPGLVDGIQKLDEDRKYAQANTAVDQVLPKLQPVYDAYVKQQAAKTQYDAQLKLLEPKLPKSSLPADQMPPDVQKAIADAQSQMEAAAKA